MSVPMLHRQLRSTVHSRKTRHSLLSAQCIGVEIHTVLVKLNQAGVKPRIRRNDGNSPLSKFHK